MNRRVIKIVDEVSGRTTCPSDASASLDPRDECHVGYHPPSRTVISYKRLAIADAAVLRAYRLPFYPSRGLVRTTARKNPW